MKQIIQIAVDPFPRDEELSALWQSAWVGPLRPTYTQELLRRSLAHIAAYDVARLVGFVNIARDEGIHAFILDTCVHSDYQRQGIATILVTFDCKILIHYPGVRGRATK
jgi:ribosomal protein S18 acetylase RimI-like enzyme